MSLSFLRDAVIKHLQTLADAAAQSAIDMQVHPEMSSDRYALMQVNKLAYARGLTEAARVVTREYKRLTEAPPDDTTQTEPDPDKMKEERFYG